MSSAPRSRVDRPPRIGFVGCGSHASHNLYPALRHADCELVAACDLWENNRHLARRAFGASRTYESFEPMLEQEELDGVIVCGPYSVHYAATKAALERGLPVLVEKPPAENLAQALELREIARRQGVTLMVAFMKRFARYYRMARAICARPEFGSLTHLFLRYSYHVSGEAGRTLAGMAVHPLDLMRHFLGNPTRMQVMRHLWEGGYHSFSLQFGFPQGASASLVLNATAPAPLERLELTGEGAMVVVDELNELRYYRPQEKPWAPPVAEIHHPNTALQTVDNASSELQGYLGEVSAFIAAVRSGQAPEFATIDDGVAAMRLVEIITGAGDGAVLDLPDLCA